MKTGLQLEIDWYDMKQVYFKANKHIECRINGYMQFLRVNENSCQNLSLTSYDLNLAGHETCEWGLSDWSYEGLKCTIWERLVMFSSKVRKSSFTHLAKFSLLLKI